MLRKICICIISVLSPLPAFATNDTWFPVGFNDKRIATAWVQLRSYSVLNSDSFRLNAKFTNNNGVQIVGRIDMNCRNKDWYFRPRGLFSQHAPWAAIPQGSGIEFIAKYFCQNTSARSDWGYTDETRHLWEQDAPVSHPGNASGEWVLVQETDEAEVYYNDEINKKDDSVQAAVWSRAKKGERSAVQPNDTQGYTWINVDCRSNLYSNFVKPDINVEGIWFSPVLGRPGGAAMQIRKKFC